MPIAPSSVSADISNNLADSDSPPIEERVVAVEAEVPPVSRRSTRCIPLDQLALSGIERRKVDRYLDVTKSAMLFGGRVLLVEGIAETLLLPIIAKKHVLNGDAEKLRLFRSAVFVPIDGVDFDCYVRLLLTPYNDIRIADRVVVLTDGDRKNEVQGVATAGELRKTKLDTLVATLGGTSLFHSVINTYSLESELVRAGNAAAMKEIYLSMHPRSEEKWDNAVTLIGDNQASAIQSLFEDTRKGDFAQLLAEAITSAEAFTVPEYIRQAIVAIVQ
jgi:putative ATP-dependent endonuclease of OLD family